MKLTFALLAFIAAPVWAVSPFSPDAGANAAAAQPNPFVPVRTESIRPRKPAHSAPGEIPASTNKALPFVSLQGQDSLPPPLPPPGAGLPPLPPPLPLPQTNNVVLRPAPVISPEDTPTDARTGHPRLEECSIKAVGPTNITAPAAGGVISLTLELKGSSKCSKMTSASDGWLTPEVTSDKELSITVSTNGSAASRTGEVMLATLSGDPRDSVIVHVVQPAQQSNVEQK